MSGAIKRARGATRGDPAMGYRAMPGIGYRQGDPGLFGFIGKAISKVTGAVGSILPGPLGTVARGVSKIFGRKSAPILRQAPQQFQPMFQFPGSGPSQAFPRSSFAPMNGGTNVVPWAPGQQPRGKGTVIMAGPGGACPPGYRPNKTEYFVTSPLGTPSFVSKGERCVKIRRRNSLNPRALDRAMSRVIGANRIREKLKGWPTTRPCPR